MIKKKKKKDVNSCKCKGRIQELFTLLCRSCLKEAKRVQVAQLTIDDGA